MSMHGNWLRVSPAELTRVADDLGQGYQLFLEVSAAEEADPPDEPRWYCSDKTWHALEFLLDRRGFPVSLATGEESFVELPDDEEEALDLLDDPDIAWGYGPPWYLTPEQVRSAADALAGVTAEELISGVDPAELARAEVYPETWDRPGELEWAVHHLADVRDYFAGAARSGDAVICWIS